MISISANGQVLTFTAVLLGVHEAPSMQCVNVLHFNALETAKMSCLMFRQLFFLHCEMLLVVCDINKSSCLDSK